MRSRSERAGFTLLEVLVATGILAIVGLLLVQIFGVSKTTFQLGSSRITLLSAARESMDRIVPILVTANPDLAAGPQALQSIPNGIRLISYLDYLGRDTLPGRDGQVAFDSTIANDPHYYQIEMRDQDGDGDNDIVLEEWNGTWTAAEVFAGNPRVLARSYPEVRIQNLQLDILDYGPSANPAGVKVTMTVEGDVRRATGQLDQPLRLQLENIATIPFYMAQTSKQ